MTDQYCPMRPGPCRHVSIPLEVKRIERFKQIGSLQVPDGFETRCISIPGKEYCNNYCAPVSEIGHCNIHPTARTGGADIRIIEVSTSSKTRQSQLEGFT